MVKIALELSENEAAALAQFVKRIGVEDIRPLTADEDELYEAWHSILKIQDALAGSGYAPR